MKKSSLIVMITIIGLAGVLMSANLTLKKEYSNGHIKNPFITTALPAFHFVSANFDSTSKNGGVFNILATDNALSQVSALVYDTGKINLTVANDTLFIKKNSTDQSLYGNEEPIQISTPTLEAIIANKGLFNVTTEKIITLSIYAANDAVFNLRLNHINTVDLNAAGRAEIALMSKDTINTAQIKLGDESSLKVEDVIIRNKNLQFSKKAGIRLSGRSVANFGVMTKNDPVPSSVRKW